MTDDCVTTIDEAGVSVLELPQPPAEPEEEPVELPPAAMVPLPLLSELRQAYETAMQAVVALEQQQAYVRQRSQALIEQMQSVQHQARMARNQDTIHQKLTEVIGLYDHVAELDAQSQRLQRQRDVQALAVLATGTAYRECREEARRMLNALRVSQQAAAALPSSLAAMELDHAAQILTHLAALIGEAAAQAVAAQATLWPAWLREE